MIQGVLGRDKGKAQDLGLKYVKIDLNCLHVCENFLHTCLQRHPFKSPWLMFHKFLPTKERLHRMNISYCEF